MATSQQLNKKIKALEATLKKKSNFKPSVVAKLETQLKNFQAELRKLTPKKSTAKKPSVLQKLKKMVKTKTNLKVYNQAVDKSGRKTDLVRDADRPALPTGRRVSKGTGANQYGKAVKGRVYYENRPNRIDVKQPPKRYPKLEEGGMMAKNIYLISDDGYEVNISESDFMKETRMFFKKSMTQQEVNKLGTSKYNQFIHYLSKKGYEKMADGGMFEEPIAMYRPLSGKTSGKAVVGYDIPKEEFDSFVEYVYDVYNEEGFNKSQVRVAIKKYLRDLEGQYTWGGGDSLDRERVYEYLKNPKQRGIANPHFKEGGMMAQGGRLNVVKKYNTISDYLKDAKRGDLVLIGRDENDLEWIGDSHLNRFVKIDEEGEGIFQIFGRKGLFSFPSNKNVIVVDRKYEDGGMMAKGGFVVFNYTDNIHASNEVFKTKKEAKEFIENFRNRFNQQGYYRTNYGERIPTNQIDLEVIPEDFNPFKKMSDGGMMANEYPISDARKPIIKEGYILLVKDTEQEAKDYISKYPDLYYEKYNDKWAIKKSFEEGGMMAKGGSVLERLKKAKEMGIKGYGKEKEYTQKQIHDKKKSIALDVIVDTLNDDYFDTKKGRKDIRAVRITEELVEEKYAKGGMTLDAIQRKYNSNEDKNYHSENVVLLAENFGTDEEKSEAKEILKRHNQEGSLSSELYKKRGILEEKLWDKFQKAKKMANSGMMAKGAKIPFLKFEDAILAKKIVKKGELPSNFSYVEKEKKLYYLPNITADWIVVGEFDNKKESINFILKELEAEGFAKGGMTEISDFKTNLMGTASFMLQLPNMRKPQEFIVYPIQESDNPIITIQSDTRIGKIDLSSGRGLMSESHASGAYFVHLQMDKKTPFQLNDMQLSELKLKIKSTGGKEVGSRGIISDNSGALNIMEMGGKVQFKSHRLNN